MASSTPHTIAVQTHGALFRKEALAGGAITPGHLVQFDASNELVVHASAAAVLQGKKIALESPTPDSATAWSIDVAIADGDRAYYCDAQPGERFYMWLDAGENAALNAQLQSAGNGALQVVTVDANTLANSVVGVAKEAYNNGAGGSPVRLLVEII